MNEGDIFIPGFDDGFDKNLRFDLDGLPGVTRSVVIYLKGQIDNFNSAFFQKKMNRVIESRYRNIIFRCSSLDYVSSTGIGIFTKFFLEIKNRGGNVVFMDLQPKVYEVFQLLGFTHFFNIRNSLEEAVEFFNDERNMKISIFPLSFECPLCNAKLRTTHEGRFRCSNCKALISVSNEGKISI